MPKDEKQRNEVPSKKKGKSLLILSAVTALFIGVMGYEVIRENEPKNLKSTDEKKLLISRNKGLYEKTEKINLNLLKAENRHFSTKIIALKEEAHANLKRLHDLQISLLSAKQSKENKEISSLKEELKKEEMLNLSLDETLERLKSDIQNKEEQIVKDQVSYVSLNNSHRQLEIKLGTLHNQSSDEKEDLVKTIYQLEAAHTMLKMEMQEHLVQIQNLETSQASALAEKMRLTKLVFELENSENQLKDANKEYIAEIEKREAEIEKHEDLNGKLSLIALDKELEADHFKEDYQAAQLVHQSHATNLSMVIETEQLASHLFQRELHYHASELASAKELLKNSETLLENLSLQKAEQDRQVEFFIKEIDEKNEMLSLNKNLFEDLKIEVQETYSDLNLSLAEQQQKAVEYNVSQLHDLCTIEELSFVLLEELAKKQSEFDQLKLVQHALSHDRNTLKSLINDKDNQISALDDSIAKLEEAYTIQNEKMNAELESYANLENEKTNLDALLQTRTEQLEEMKALVILNQQTNEKLAVELENHVKMKNENESLYAFEIAKDQVVNEAFMKNLSELNDLLNLREYQLKEMTAFQHLNQESNQKITGELEIYLSEIVTEKANREAIEKKSSELAALINLREEQLEEAKASIILNQESKEAIAMELENYTKEIANEKANRETIEKNLNELIALIELREQQLEETTALCALNLESNEKVAVELENYYQEIANEKTRREAIEKDLTELAALVELREQQLEEAKALATLNLESNEIQALQLENYSTEITAEKANREAIEKSLSELTALVELREEQLEEAKTLCILNQESNEEAVANQMSYYTQQIDNEKTYRETIEQNITDFAAHITLCEQQLEDAKALALLNSEFKEKAVLELESYLSEIANEKANREAVEKNVSELAALIALREQQLEEVKAYCIQNQESMEKATFNLESYYLKKIATEKANREAIEDNIIDLADLIDLREEQLEEAKTLCLSNLTSKEEIAKEFENSSKTNVEKENQYVFEIANEKAMREAIEKNVNELTAQLLSRTEQFEEIKAFADQKMQFNEELTQQIANLEFENSEKTQLHKKKISEIEVYTKALDQALILQDIEKNAAVQLEVALEELKVLVQSKEITNQELAKVIVKQEEYSQNIFREFEQVKALKLKNEMEANNLAELLLFKEKELSDLKMALKDNSINKEVELIQTANLNTKLQTQVEDLAFELNKYKEQLNEAWTTYKVAQEKTVENENQLNSLVEVLFRREHELLKALSDEENL